MYFYPPSTVGMVRTKRGQLQPFLGHHLSPTLDDVHGMVEFGLALGSQISMANKVYKKNTGNSLLPFQSISLSCPTEPYVYPHFIKAFDNSLTLSVILRTGV